MSDKRLPVGTFDQIINADDTMADGELIEIPEWGCSVRVRGLTRGEVRQTSKEDMTVEQAEVFTLVSCVLDPKLSEEQARQIVHQKGYRPTEALMDKIAQLSGLVPGFREGDTD